MVSGVLPVMYGLSRLRRHLLRRSLRSWILVRATFAIALLMTLNPPLPTGGAIALGVVVLATIVGLLDVERANERVFLANLGLRLATLSAILATFPLLGEVLLAIWLPGFGRP